MADVTNITDRPVRHLKAMRGDAPTACHTDRLVRETWRHYYVARLAEAQFGPESLEASIAHSRALVSYRELRGSLRDMDPYYRPPEAPPRAASPAKRHLHLVRDTGPELTITLER